MVQGAWPAERQPLAAGPPGVPTGRRVGPRARLRRTLGRGRVRDPRHPRGGPRIPRRPARPRRALFGRRPDDIKVLLPGIRAARCGNQHDGAGTPRVAGKSGAPARPDYRRCHTTSTSISHGFHRKKCCRCSTCQACRGHYREVADLTRRSGVPLRELGRRYGFGRTASKLHRLGERRRRPYGKLARRGGVRRIHDPGTLHAREPRGLCPARRARTATTRI